MNVTTSGSQFYNINPLQTCPQFPASWEKTEKCYKVLNHVTFTVVHLL